MLTTDDEDPACLSMNWVETDIEICLDSSCCEHVMDLGDVPGYSAFLTESPGSNRRQGIIVGNGECVPSKGQLLLKLESSAADGLRKSRGACRLPSLHDGTEVLVLDKSETTLVRFHRSGGLYISKMRLKDPEGLGGQPR